MIKERPRSLQVSNGKSEIKVIKERPRDLQVNNRNSTFRARPHPAKSPIFERKIPKVFSTPSPGQRKFANVVKEGESPSRICSQIRQFHSCGSGFRGTKGARVKGLSDLPLWFQRAT